MGDLIQKLPTDSIQMPPEERENFLLLFPEEQVMPAAVQSSSPQDATARNLKKEIMTLSMFILVFFVLNLPFVKNLLVEYIPLCHKSWIMTNLLQAIVFAFVLWLFLNAEYSRASK